MWPIKQKTPQEIIFMEQNQEEKNDKLNLTKIKNFYSPKDKRMKRQVTV